MPELTELNEKPSEAAVEQDGLDPFQGDFDEEAVHTRVVDGERVPVRYPARPRQVAQPSPESLDADAVKLLESLDEEQLDGLRLVAREQREAQAATEFVRMHPEYLPTPQNATAITNFLENANLPKTRENLERAYTILRESGDIEIKKKRVSSALRARRYIGPTPVNAEEKLLNKIENLPLEEARDLVANELYRRAHPDKGF